MPELRALPELPVYIEEDHHEVQGVVGGHLRKPYFHLILYRFLTLFYIQYYIFLSFLDSSFNFEGSAAYLQAYRSSSATFGKQYIR